MTDLCCRDAKQHFVCATDVAGVRTTLVAFPIFEHDASGVPIVIGQYFTDGVDNETRLDPADYASTVAGECPVAQPDVEWERLCDVQGDGTVIPFLRRSITSFDASGSVIDPVQVDDFELDKVTAYTVTGTVDECGGCEPLGSLGTLV